MPEVKPGMDPCTGAMGVEVCCGPGSYASLFIITSSSTSFIFIVLRVCPNEAEDGMGRELGAEADALAFKGLIARFVQGSEVGPSSGAGLESWA